MKSYYLDDNPTWVKTKYPTSPENWFARRYISDANYDEMRRLVKEELESLDIDWEHG